MTTSLPAREAPPTVTLSARDGDGDFALYWEDEVQLCWEDGVCLDWRASILTTTLSARVAGSATSLPVRS